MGLLENSHHGIFVCLRCEFPMRFKRQKIVVDGLGFSRYLHIRKEKNPKKNLPKEFICRNFEITFELYYSKHLPLFGNAAM